MELIPLGANQPPDRFYLGGELIARFRGTAARSDHVPEDWVASTTTLAGHESLGLTTLPDGRTLKAAVEADAEAWLGPRHVAAFGSDTMLLVKLLHAGQRLPVHAHPDRAFARTRLGHAHGKVEAWHILVGGDVYLGLREDANPAALVALVDAQAVDELLGLLHRRRVAPGDTVYVPAGMLHAIGPGILLAELQEPEDLSILLEWEGFELDGRTHGHLGLGFDTALTAVDHRALAPGDLDALVSGGGEQALPPAADDYFRLERVQGAATLDPGFAVLIVTHGVVEIAAGGSALRLAAGGTAVVPWSAGPLTVTGDGELLVARPPSA